MKGMELGGKLMGEQRGEEEGDVHRGELGGEESDTSSCWYFANIVEDGILWWRR